jgi:hypothetical protein
MLRMGRASCVLILGLLCLLGAAACGGEDDDGGAAGTTPIFPMALGDSCAAVGGTLPCPSGLSCGSALFPKQCTIQCAQSSACGLHSTASPTGRPAVCFGVGSSTGGGSCGISCTGNEDCPAGATCQPKADGMGCAF